jgi:Cft2 family RNA processing exonuclease
MPVFHWDNGLVLSQAALPIDFQRRQPQAFISHAHTDHIARHELALCTPETAALYRHRLGPRPTRDMPYRQPLDWGGLRLTTYPAGHCLGSAMLLAEDGEQSLLYTGDFKLGPSATAEQAELPHADILVIESTFGEPRYRLPPRQQAVAQLLELVHAAIAADAVPVVFAYALGKAQEVTRLLTDAGVPVVQHRQVFAVSQVYEACGMLLGRHEPFAGSVEPGWALVMPPHLRPPEQLGRTVTMVTTGWAADPRTKYRFGVDHAIPLSDHADYDDLFAAIEQVGPRRIYCTHGPESFVERLRETGLDAYPLGRSRQGRLF